MTTNPHPPAIRFDDGAGYERYMGVWSALVGERFLDWIGPERGARWLDVGCGNGAFTEMISRRAWPASVHGLDPSEGQLAFARARPGARGLTFVQGDAMAQPFPDGAFDIAVLSLVIFFIPDPLRGVIETTRVVRPGGLVASYAWDLVGGGFPYQPLLDEIRALGIPISRPPKPEAGDFEALRGVWSSAGLEKIETREIAVERTFANFDDYWQTVVRGPSVGAALAAADPETTARLQARVRARLRAGADGRITAPARAHAIKGTRRAI